MLGKLTGNKMVLGAVVGVLGGLVVAVLLVFVLGVGSSPAPATEAAKGEPAKAAAAKATPKKGEPVKYGPTYTIRDRIVNLADPGGRRYLRFTVAIEFEPHADPTKADAHGDEAATHLLLYVPGEDGGYQEVVPGKPGDAQKAFDEAVKKFVPAMEDAVMTILSSKTFAEVSSAEGKEQAKKEIKDRVQAIVGDEEHVTNVYFTEFVVQ